MKKGEKIIMKLNLNIPRIESDEEIMGWIDRICEMNAAHSNSEKSYLLRIVFDQDIRTKKHGIQQKYFYNLSTFCQIYENDDIWPDIIEIMKHHTDYYATLPFRTYADQAMLAETIISPRTGTNKDVKMRLSPSREKRYCPLCRQEDGAPIEHVPHQLPGVHVCYKHGIKLQSDGKEIELIGNMDYERFVAVFMKELYDNPVFIGYEEIRDYIRSNKIDIKDLETFIKRFEIREETAHRLRALFVRSVRIGFRNTDQNLFSTILFLYFQNRRSLFEKVNISMSLKDKYEKTIRESYNRKTDFGPLILHECIKCRKQFWSHPMSIILQAGCPTCNLSLSAEDIVKRRLKAQGRYMLVDAFKGWEHKYSLINIRKGISLNISMFKALGDLAYDADESYKTFENIEEVKHNLPEWEKTVGYENKLRHLNKVISNLNDDMEVLAWNKVKEKIRFKVRCKKCGTIQEYSVQSFKQRPYCKVCSGQMPRLHTQATVEQALENAGLSIKANSFCRRRENIYVNITCPACKSCYDIHMGYLLKKKICRICGQPL